MSSPLTASALYSVNMNTLSGGTARGAEVAVYDAQRKLALVLGASGVDFLDAATGARVGGIGKADVQGTGGDPTALLGSGSSVAVYGDRMAVAFDGAAAGANGFVAMFQLNATGSSATWLYTVTRSTPGSFAVPDMLTFTPDGSKLLVAIEGEPASSYSIDPAGGIGVIDVATGTMRIAGFTAFDEFKAELKAAGVRLAAPSDGAMPVAGAALVSKDVEPEYIAVSDDGRTAYVTLQEANALAVVDLTGTPLVTAILPFGAKDHSIAGNGMDTSDQDGLSGANANIRTVPVKGLTMPDAIADFTWGGKTYLVTANEGDAREYSAFSDFARLNATSGGQFVIQLDPGTFGANINTVGGTAGTVRDNADLGRLSISRVDGDTDGDGDIDVLHSMGARSFSIWTVEDGQLRQTFDSGDLIERTLKTQFPTVLDDSRSDDKGPEPEHVALGTVDGKLYAFVGLERATNTNSAIMAFEITSPTSASFAGLVTTTGTGQQGPEVFAFVPQASAPATVGNAMLLVPNEVAGRFQAVEFTRNYTLQILHASDFEAGLLAVDRAPKFAAIVDKVEDQVANSITLASGDNYIPSPFFAAQGDSAITVPLREFYAQLLGVPVSQLSALVTDLGRVDIAIMNALGVQASVFGNHEFDLGTRTILNAIDMTRSGSLATAIGAQFPYLSANLDFSGDADMNGIFTELLRDAASYATTAADLADLASITAEAADRQIAPWTTITEGGETIGVLGLTTQILASISSVGGVRIKDPAGDGGVNNTTELAQILQPYVDQMTAKGINKIILLSHLQQYQLELDLATKLSGVDIIIAGGSHAVFADATDSLTGGVTVAQNYPVIRTGADGRPVAVVNTGGEYYNVGRLVVDFDSNGVIIPASIDPAVSGAYVANDATVAALWGNENPYADGTRGGEVKQLADAVDAVIDAKSAVVAGYSNVYLQGQRGFVRTQETNFGNLSADANLAFARANDAATVISLKNGGGIREGIGVVGTGEIPTYDPPAGGTVTQLDIENALRFNNGLSLITVTAQGLANILENALRGVAPGATPGGFPQVSGLKFSFDATRPAGDRILSLAVLDGAGNVADVVVKNGDVVGNVDRSFRLVTLNFLADGGDGYLGAGGGAAVTVTNRVDLFTGATGTYTTPGREQKVLADYLAANFGTPEKAYTVADTAQALDTRVQNLAFRAEDVLPASFAFEGTAGNDSMAGSGADDVLNGNAGNDTINAAGGNDSVNAGDGDDSVQGGAGLDTIQGGAGNDTAAGGAGDDSIDGGAGSDAAVYDVARSAATVVRTGPGAWTVTTASGGTDTLVNVERVQFTDGSLWTTSEAAYNVPSQPNVRVVSILSAGDVAGVKPDGTPWRMVGIPDGLGAFDNNDGTITVLLNHEIGATNGVVREHGAIGSFVSRIVLDKATLAVVAADDLAQDLYLWDGTGYVLSESAIGRLCSADLPPVSAFYDAATGLGTQDLIFMNGEETGAEGRAFAWVVTGTEARTAWELPKLGKFSWENSVASPYTGSKTVVIGTDDSTPGQVYFYIGDKQATGTTIEKAGLTNGTLYGIAATGIGNGTSSEAALAGNVPLSGSFGLVALANSGNGAALQAESNAAGVTEWWRPEDGQWDVVNQNRFYFVTTASTSGPSRLWALDFVDARDPSLGGTFTALLDGTEGHRMLDNMTVAADGTLILQEDAGSNARLGKQWHYDPRTDILTEVTQHDPARFLAGAPAFLTQDEEASGVIDVTAMLGDADTKAFLFDTQAHYSFGASGSADRTEIVQGGQLQVMYVDLAPAGTAGDDSIQGTFLSESLDGAAGDDSIAGAGGFDTIQGGAGDDTVNGGAGNDSIDGGAGRDVALFEGASSAATWTRDPATGAWTVTTATGGTDQVRGVEALRFDDRTVQLPGATVPSDGDGNGTTDLLWQHQSGALVGWLMNGPTAMGFGLNTLPAGLTIAGSGDLSGDARADLVIRGPLGSFFLWTAGDDGSYSPSSIAFVDAAWKVAALGDLNGDGKSDILWRHDDGTVVGWLMDGASYIGGGTVAKPGTSWSVAALADVDADGRADIVWQDANGAAAVWTMDGITPTAAAAYEAPSPTWRIVGAGDFGGDGKADLLWRDSATGDVALWQMDGLSVVAGGSGTVARPGTGWNVADIGDYGGNGKSDILWRGAGGDIALWQMDGLTVASTHSLGRVSAEWSLV